MTTAKRVCAEAVDGGDRAVARVHDALWADAVLPFLSPEQLARALARTSRWGRDIVRRTTRHHRRWTIVPERVREPGWDAFDAGLRLGPPRHRWHVPPPNQCTAFRLRELRVLGNSNVLGPPVERQEEMRATLRALVHASAPTLETLFVRHVPLLTVTSDVVAWPVMPALRALDLRNDVWIPSDMHDRAKMVTVEAWFQTHVPALEALACDDAGWLPVAVLPHLGQLRRLHINTAATADFALERVLRLDTTRSLRRLTLECGWEAGEWRKLMADAVCRWLCERPALEVLDLLRHNDLWGSRFRVDRTHVGGARVHAVFDAGARGLRLSDLDDLGAQVTHVVVELPELRDDLALRFMEADTNDWLERVQPTHLALRHFPLTALSDAAVARVQHLHLIGFGGMCHEFRPDIVSLARFCDRAPVLRRIDLDVPIIDPKDAGRLWQLPITITHIGLHDVRHDDDRDSLDARRWRHADPRRVRWPSARPWFREKE